MAQKEQKTQRHVKSGRKEEYLNSNKLKRRYKNGLDS